MNLRGGSRVGTLVSGVPSTVLPSRVLPSRVLPSRVLPSRVLPSRLLPGGVPSSMGRSSTVSTLASAVLFVAGFGLVACSEGDADPTANAGQAGSTAGSGTGGSGTGGSGTGGSAGTGTGTANGGTSAGQGGAAPVGPTTTLAFGTGLETLRVNYYCIALATATEPGGNCTQVMAGAAPAADAGADAGDAGPGDDTPQANDFYALSFDSTVGQPNPGSAKLELQFGVVGQLADVALNITGVNLTGKTVTAQVRVEAGAPPTTFAKMYLKTGLTYIYGDSGEKLLTPGAWVPVTFTTASYSNPGFSLADVREIGIEFGIGPAEAAFSPAVIHIDTLSY
jgi:hypothetical protein